MVKSGNTTGFQLSYNKAWLSKWYVDSNYSQVLHEDILLRTYLTNKIKLLDLYHSKILIKRVSNNITIVISIPKFKRNKSKQLIKNNDIISENEIQIIKSTLQKITEKKINLVIQVVNNFDAQILAQYVATKLESRKKLKGIFDNLIRKLNKQSNIIGFKLQLSGRQKQDKSAARAEWYKYNRIPLRSFNINVDYAFTTALTATYGVWGVKIWIAYK